ncbi:MAG: hypothetical protein IJU71_07950, partial [Selenomonadaceae bacterium]|nr:hypothetical protein [Selenomonadaceae bacterium]
GGCSVQRVDDKSTNDVTVKAQAELIKMTKRADEDAKKQEADILKDINETMDDFIAWLKDENEKKYDGVSLNINIDRIEKLNADLREDVVGFIGRKLSNRLVMTDKELDRILAEPDDGKRTKNFNDFYDRILREAIRELIKTIEESVKKQSESIEAEIQLRLNEVNKNLEREVREFEELQAATKSEGDALARKQVEYMYQDALCDVMLDELSGGTRKRKGA